MSDAHVQTIIEFIGLLVSAGGLGAVAYELAKSRRADALAQQREADELVRRKRQATIDFYNQTLEFRTRYRDRIPDNTDPVAVRAFVERALAVPDGPERTDLADFLGYFEMLATAVRLDVLDLETIDALAGQRLMSTFRSYQPYVVARRERTGRTGLYKELEWLARRIGAHRGLDPAELSAVTSWTRPG